MFLDCKFTCNCSDILDDTSPCFGFAHIEAPIPLVDVPPLVGIPHLGFWFSPNLTLPPQSSSPSRMFSTINARAAVLAFGDW